MNEEQNRAIGRGQLPATQQDIYRLEQRIAALEPVKKAGNREYSLQFFLTMGEHPSLYEMQLDLTPTAALKLSEAISAVLEQVTTHKADIGIVITKVEEAAKAYQESQ